MIVYCYTNKTNGKKYIGVTSRTMEEREKSHLYEAYNEKSETYNTPFKRAIRKYGIDGFERTILHSDVTQEQASALERCYIEEFKTYYKYQNSNGYNATLGGELTISSPKDKVVQVDINTYEKLYTYDSVTEAENKYGRGIWESCNRVLNIPHGYMWYYEKDFLNMTNEQIKEDINTRLGRIVQLTMNGEFVKIWDGSTQAGQELKTNQRNISSCCLGKRKSANGYMWMFFSDYIKNGAKEYSTNKDRSKKIGQYSKEGELIKIFDSATLASKETGTCLSSISNVCKGKRNIANGFKWKYITN